MDKIIYNVLKKIEDNGFKAYLVGGYVRDHLLRKSTKDIDICTNARVKDLKEIFNNSKLTLFDYGNVILEINDYSFEITTFRKDICYIDNRKPESIVYVDTLEEDIIRRDFTINSICMDKNGTIIDLLGGRKDLFLRVIKSIGDPDIRFKEDALRMLRAIRFASVLSFKLDFNVKNAIIKNKHLLKNLSETRKVEELSKIFCCKNKKYAIKLIKDLGLEAVLNIKNIDKILLTNDLMGIWAMVADDSYSWSKSQRTLIKEIKELYNIKDYNNYVLYKFGFYTMSIVCDLKKLNKSKYFKKYENLPIHERKEINISSEEICSILNKNPDKFLKDIFLDIENKILDKSLNNSNDDLKKYIENNYAKL